MSPLGFTASTALSVPPNVTCSSVPLAARRHTCPMPVGPARTKATQPFESWKSEIVPVTTRVVAGAASGLVSFSAPWTRYPTVEPSVLNGPGFGFAGWSVVKRVVTPFWTRDKSPPS
jgi:hypothetical protein